MTEASEKRELASEAKEMLGRDGAFAKAVIEVRRRLFDQLLMAPVGSGMADEIHAQLKLLPALAGELQAFITDYDMAQRRSRT